MNERSRFIKDGSLPSSVCAYACACAHVHVCMRARCSLGSRLACKNGRSHSLRASGQPCSPAAGQGQAAAVLSLEKPLDSRGKQLALGGMSVPVAKHKIGGDV